LSFGVLRRGFHRKFPDPTADAVADRPLAQAWREIGGYGMVRRLILSPEAGCSGTSDLALIENFIADEILTFPELAARLKVSVSGLRKILRRNGLPGAFKVGQQWRFRWALVVRFLSTEKETDKWHD
jgi:excisionase family DNA binding protein